MFFYVGVVKVALEMPFNRSTILPLLLTLSLSFIFIVVGIVKLTPKLSVEAHRKVVSQF